jgi:hypothetical protein
MSSTQRLPGGPGAAWQGSRTRIFLDSHTPDWADPFQRGPHQAPHAAVLTAADPEPAMRRIAESGADSVVLFAKCQYGNSYFPTSVGHQHSALAGRDLFGEQLAAARRLGLRVIAYFSNMWDSHEAGAHPDWRLVALEGRPDLGRWPTLCLLSDYRSLVMAHIHEIAERYEIDGLWSDILTAGPCACSRCRGRFASQYGFAMPQRPDEPGWADLVDFWGGVLDEYVLEQRATLDAVRPSTALVPNFYGTTFTNAVSGLTMAHLDRADIGSSEGYTDWQGLAFPSFAARYVRAAVRERPAEVVIGRFVHTWDFTMVSTPQLRYEAFSAVVNGVCATVDDQPYADGSLEPEVYRRVGDAFGEIRSRAPYLEGAEPVRYAALYASQGARVVESVLRARESATVGDEAAAFPPSRPRPGLSDLEAAVTGTYRALLECHVPLDFVDDLSAVRGGLSPYRVVVLPDVVTLTAAEIGALRDFVERGGGLVTTGPVGIVDRHGHAARAGEGLDSLLGVSFGEIGRYSFPYLQLRDDALVGSVGGWLLSHYGPIHELRAVGDGVEVLATRTDPVLETDQWTFWHNNQPAPGLATGDPVIVERRLGAGRVIACAARLGNNHARLGHGAYRDLLGALVCRAAAAEPPVEVLGGHRNTELALTRCGDDLVAHLVTGNPVRGLELLGARLPGVIEDIARTALIEVKVPSGATRALRVGPGGDAVEVPIGPDGVVALRDAGDWETLVLVDAARSDSSRGIR